MTLTLAEIHLRCPWPIQLQFKVLGKVYTVVKRVSLGKEIPKINIEIDVGLFLNVISQSDVN